jgi:hypothetical protein
LATKAAWESNERGDPWQQFVRVAVDKGGIRTHRHGVLVESKGLDNRRRNIVEPRKRTARQ